MPIRLMITWINVYVARDMPKTMVAPSQNCDVKWYDSGPQIASGEDDRTSATMPAWIGNIWS